MTEIQLLKRDITLIPKFQAWCSLKRLERFSADDFRDYLAELNKELTDPAHDTGRIFRTMIVKRQVREVGRVRSRIPENHGREIRLYEWTQ